EIDFGTLGRVWDPERKRERLTHALIVTLVYSRHQYVHCSHGQKLEDVIAALEDAWQFFGGVAARVVLDNLKAAVTKADRYDPDFQRTFEDYARYRGFVIDPAVVRHPQGKPHVERGVSYVRENLFRGENWLDVDHVQREALRWCRQEAGMRIHGTTRKRPLVVFEEEERAALLPLEKERYDVPGWAECKVHRDRHIQFDKAIYSLPTRYVGHRVTVRGDRSLVRIYFRGEQIKTHARQPPGGRSTDTEDYPEPLIPYATRDPYRLIRRAAGIGKQTEHFVAELLGGTFPWAKLRQAQRLFRLAEKYGARRMEAACARAVAFELINVRRLERILVHGIEATAETPPGKQQTLLALPARFLRGEGSFNHPHSRKEKDDHGDRSLLEERPQEAPSLGHRTDPARSHQLREQEEARPGRLPGTGAPGRD
ncbi:MAG: IS21 family transposase, partial [Acidobacteriota bacterium]